MNNQKIKAALLTAGWHSGLISLCCQCRYFNCGSLFFGIKGRLKTGFTWDLYTLAGSGFEWWFICSGVSWRVGGSGLGGIHLHLTMTPGLGGLTDAYTQRWFEGNTFTTLASFFKKTTDPPKKMFIRDTFKENMSKYESKRKPQKQETQTSAACP